MSSTNFGQLLLIIGGGLLAAEIALGLTENVSSRSTASTPISQISSVEYVETDAYRFEKDLLQRSKVLSIAAQDIAYNLDTNNNQVQVKECGAINAYYYPHLLHTSGKIVYCYEILRSMISTFEGYGMSKTEAQRKALYATVAIFLHEKGHAVIDERVAMVEREEDAADEFATTFLLSKTSYGAEAVLALGLYLSLIDRRTERSPGDDHSVGRDRLTAAQCMTWASNEQRFGYLANEIPNFSADVCRSAYQKALQFWNF